MTAAGIAHVFRRKILRQAKTHSPRLDMTPATPKINAYDELLAIEASALNKLRISHYEAQEELLRVPDAGDTNCAAFDHAVREACECAIPDAWLPLGGGETTRDVRVPAGHFALVHHLRRDLPWLGRPCPHTAVPADYGLVVRPAPCTLPRPALPFTAGHNCLCTPANILTQAAPEHTSPAR